MTTLFVSPSESDHHTLKNIFSRSRWNLHAAFAFEEAFTILRQESVQVVIFDCHVAGGGWRVMLENLASLPAPPKLIAASREMTKDLWADVLQMGGYDLLSIPWDPQEVLRVTSLAWRCWDFKHRDTPAKRSDASRLIRAAAGN